MEYYLHYLVSWSVLEEVQHSFRFCDQKQSSFDQYLLLHQLENVLLVSKASWNKLAFIIPLNQVFFQGSSQPIWHFSKIELFQLYANCIFLYLWSVHLWALKYYNSISTTHQKVLKRIVAVKKPFKQDIGGHKDQTENLLEKIWAEDKNLMKSGHNSSLKRKGTIVLKWLQLCQGEIKN